MAYLKVIFLSLKYLNARKNALQYLQTLTHIYGVAIKQAVNTDSIGHVKQTFSYVFFSMF